MNKLFVLLLFLFFSLSAFTQVIGYVDKRTKEFIVPAGQKIEYRVFGYMFPAITTPKMICFSSYAGDVTANFNECKLGSYYDTGRMKVGDDISYAGVHGSFAKMIFTGTGGKKTTFYLPKGCFVIK